jgi:hypothetical protein
MRSTQRIVLAHQEAMRRKESTKFSDEFIRIQERNAERNALHWLHRADIDVDRAKVLALFEPILRRYWTRCGYSQSWINRQFAP